MPCCRTGATCSSTDGCPEPPRAQQLQPQPPRDGRCYLTKCIPVARARSRGNATDPRHMPSPARDRADDPGVPRAAAPGRGGSTWRISHTEWARFVKNLDRMKILCIYSRGERRGQPAVASRNRGDTFSMAVEVFEPQRLEYNGLKAQRDYAGTHPAAVPYGGEVL